MSVTIQSPLDSSVFGSLDSLSPPPTPIAKRAQHFFPSRASTPTPMFFPKSQSLFRGPSGLSPAADKENAERKQLVSLASRPAPLIHLKPRPMDFTNRTARLRLSPRSSFGDKSVLRQSLSKSEVKKRVTADQIPLVPFVFPEEKTPASKKPVEDTSVFSMIPKLPSISGSLSDSSKSSAVSSKSEPIVVALKKQSGEIKPSEAVFGQQRKLPSFQRGGMHRRVVRKQNSFAARSA